MSNKSELKVRPSNTTTNPQTAPDLGESNLQVQIAEVETEKEETFPLTFDPAAGNPFPEDATLRELEVRQLTFRSVIVGSGFGLLIGAANIYLGLKIGWGMGAGLFASFCGFGVLKIMQKELPVRWGGGYFGPKENVSCQSAANGACSNYGLYVAAVPAMYGLQLLTTPEQDFGKLVGLAIVCAFYGTFFAIPLRKFYILHQKLIFPDPTAISVSIRTLHLGGEAKARRQIICLGVCFLAAFAWNVTRAYAPGILEEWHFLYWIYLWGGSSKAMMADSWGWGIVETTPAFFGLGMIAGLNATLSFYAGCIFAWGFLGPLTVHTGATHGVQRPSGFWNYFKASKGSPRYWLLWPGVFVMLCASLADLAACHKAIRRGFKLAAKELYNTIRRRPIDPDSSVEDPMGPRDQVPLWAWSSGLIMSIVLSCVLLKVQFDVAVENTILAIVLAFLFSFIGVQASGTVSINPVGPIAKCSQVVFGGISKSQGANLQDAQVTNLIAGSLAGQAANHAVDMVSDLKIGHLMSATPKGQFWAQLAGTTLTIVPLTGLFMLYAKAYPCILDHDIEDCPFGMPAVMAWKAVAIAMTETDSPIPKSSGITAIVLGAVAVATVFAKQRIPQKYHIYIPNFIAFGVPFAVPAVSLGFAMVCGSITTFFLRRYQPKIWETYGYPIAAGLAAGESCSGLLSAGLVLAGVGAGQYGIEAGAPP